MNPHTLNIYTDGSSFKKPRTGGIGVRFVFPDFLDKEESIMDLDLPGYKGGAIGQMELQACVAALREAIKLPEITRIHQVVIYTDSSYVVDNFSNAVYVWPKQKWLSKTGKPILNVELWKEVVPRVLVKIC